MFNGINALDMSIYISRKAICLTIFGGLAGLQQALLLDDFPSF